MNFIAKYSLIFLSIGVLGCSESYLADGDGVDDDGKVEVSIGGSAISSTKATLADDLESVHWESGDKIAVWAHDGSSYALAGQEFTMRYYNDAYTSADFSAKIDPMATGSYTYYGVYPVPESYTNTTTNTTATYSLPATQSGEYDDAYTIMVATPVSGDALTESTMGSESLVFKHKTHAFKIEIPDGCNNFGNDDTWSYNNYISGLDIAFSQDVVGSVAVDVTNPNTAATLSAAGKTVEVKFSEPFQTGSGKFIWAFINPTTAGGDVTFMARASDGSVSLTKTTTISNALEAGHITPISLTLPARDKIETRIKVILSPYDVKTKIGESLESVKFTLPDGVYFEGGSSSSKSYATADLPADSTYTFSFYDLTATEIAKLNAGSLGVYFETKSVTKTPESVNISGVTSGGTVDIGEVDVPYFFYTDFSEVTGSGDNIDSWDTYCSPVTIGGLTGWYGCARAKWNGDWDYVTIQSYNYRSASYYAGGINSCTIDTWGLRDGATVAVKIKCTVKWTENVHSTMYIKVGHCKTTSNYILDGSGTTYFQSSQQFGPLEDGESTDITTNSFSGLSKSSRIAWLTNGSNGSYTKGYDPINISEVYVIIDGE